MKLDLKSDSSLILNELSRLLGLAPILLMSAAMLMLVIAVFSVRDFVIAAQTEKKSLELPQFSLSSKPVSQALYTEYASVLARLSPAVDVSVGRDSLDISIASEANYPEFMFVLNSIQGVSKNVIWRAEEICLAGCEGKAATARIKGLTEKVNVKLRGADDEQ